MDAVFALYISLLALSTMMIMLEMQKNYADDPLALSRLARDVYEIKQIYPSAVMPSFISTTDCASKANIGSAMSVYYGDIGAANWNSKSNVYIGNTMVCVND